MHCVAVTMAMDMTSAGNAGQGPSSSFGTWPPRSGRMRRSWSAATIEPAAVHPRPDAEPLEAEQHAAEVVGPHRRRSTISPLVTAASPMKLPISMWSGPIS